MTTDAARAGRSASRWRAVWRPGTVLELLLTGLLLVVVLGPLAVLILRTARALAGPDAAELLQLMVPLGRRARLLWRTAVLGLGVAGVSTAIGVLVATVLLRFNRGAARYVRWGVLVLAPVPAYVHALAWDETVFRLNGWLGAIGWPTVPFAGGPAAFWVQLMALLPIAVGLALVALESVPEEMIAAGRMVRSELTTFRRVLLPLASPMLWASAGLVFVLSVLDYSVPTLYQYKVFALDVFAEYSATNSPPRALLSAVPLLVIAVIAVVRAQAGLREAAQRPTRAGAARARLRWPVGFRVLQALALVVLGLQIVVPLVSLTLAVGTWSDFMTTVSNAREEIAFSFIVALSVALAALPLAWVAARWLQRRGRGERAWWLLVTLPLAVPAPLIGVGLIVIWNRDALPPLYGTAAMPVLAALARFVSLSALVLLAQLRRIDTLLVDAARVLQSGDAQRWLQVQLPMLAPGLIAAAAVAFVLTLGELGATLIVAPPGQATLTMRIFNYLHYGSAESVASLCLMMALVSVVAAALALGALLLWGRILPEGGR